MLDEGESTDRWMISYADFITLLFAFFVTLYALSAINEGKYKVVADSLGLAFLNIQPLAFTTDLDQKPVGFQNQAIDGSVTGLHGQGSLTPNVLRTAHFQEISEEVREKLNLLIKDKMVTIRESQAWLEITLNTNILFSSGSARLLDNALEVIAPVADIIRGVSSPIQVEGFTDNIPIRNELFPSNWELSSARASAVARAMIGLDIPKERFVVVGYGANFPIATNKTLIGQQKNRRVVLVVAKNARIKRLKENTYIEQEDAETQATRQQQLIENRPQNLEQYRLQDGRIRFTTLPERIPVDATVTPLNSETIEEQ